MTGASIYINGHKYLNYDRGPGLTIVTSMSQGKNALEGSVGQHVGHDQDKTDGLRWSYLNAATWSSILKEFEEFAVTVKFPDMGNNCWKAERVYPGSRTAKIDEIGPDGLPTMYKDYKVNLIGCGVME